MGRRSRCCSSRVARCSRSWVGDVDDPSRPNRRSANGRWLSREWTSAAGQSRRSVTRPSATVMADNCPSSSTYSTSAAPATAETMAGRSACPICPTARPVLTPAVVADPTFEVDLLAQQPRGRPALRLRVFEVGDDGPQPYQEVREDIVVGRPDRAQQQVGGPATFRPSERAPGITALHRAPQAEFGEFPPMPGDVRPQLDLRPSWPGVHRESAAPRRWRVRRRDDRRPNCGPWPRRTKPKPARQPVPSSPATRDAQVVLRTGRLSALLCQPGGDQVRLQCAGSPAGVGQRVGGAGHLGQAQGLGGAGLGQAPQHAEAGEH